MEPGIPRYQQIKSEMLRCIQEGVWLEGGLIPSESQLTKRFGVSRITVRQAIGDLVSLGYLTRKQGKGTFVAHRQSGFAASRLHGFAEDLRARGHEVTIELQSIQEVPCPADIGARLNVQTLSPVMEVSRIANVGGHPVFRDTSFLVIPPGATLEEVNRYSALTNYIYGFFEQHGVTIAYGRQKIAADRATPRDIQELRIRPDDPILMIQRITYDRSGNPFEFSEVRYPAHLYQYEVNLVRDGATAGGLSW